MKPTRIRDSEIIRQWYTDERDRIKLNERQEIKLERMLFIYDKLVKDAMGSTNLAKFVSKKFSITSRQAYIDINDAKELFGDLSRVKKDAFRNVVYEYALQTFRKAKERNDIKGMNAATNNMIKVWALDKEDPELPDFDKLKQSLYPVILDDPIREMLLQIVSDNGSIDLTKFINNIATQADVIEIESKEGAV